MNLRKTAFALALSLFLQDVLFAASKAARLEAVTEQPIISRITIRGTDIFDFESNPSLNKFPYSTINLIHIRTRDQVIARELLFKVGDKLDPYLVQETERNLRGLSFIRGARIVRFPQRDGTVALVVNVSDSWTTEPQINLGGQNKVSSTEVGFKEKNLLGFGKTVSFFYERGDNYQQRAFGYQDPRLFGSRWQLTANALSRTDAQQRDVKLERPFFSADTRYSFRGSDTWRKEEIDEFVDNQKVSRFQQTKQTGEMYAGTKLGGGRDVVSHAGLRFRNTDRSYQRISKTSPDRGVPSGDSNSTLFLDLDTQRNHFEEMTHLEKMSRVEDIAMGPILKVSPGVSSEIFKKGGQQTEAESSYEQYASIGNLNRLFYNKYSYSGRDPFNNSTNQRYNVTWKYYDRTSDRHTMVVNSRADWGDKLDPDNQIKLGGDNGLRAFAVDDIVGNKGWVFNAEDRMFLVDELWNLFSVGAVFFYDSGYVWSQGQPVALSKLRSSVGTGLRLGLTRSSNEVVIRFDVSYRTQVNNPGDSHLVLSFGTGQAF